MKAKRINELLNNKLNEEQGEVDIFDKVGDDLEKIILKLRELHDETTDGRWNSALLSMLRDLYSLEVKMGNYNKKLGIIPLKEGLNLKNKNNRISEEYQNSKYFDAKIEIRVDEAIDVWNSPRVLKNFLKEAIEEYSENELYVENVEIKKYPE